MFTRFYVGLLLTTVPLSHAYSADTADEFLKLLSGKFKGHGEAVIPVSKKVERVSCSVSNTLNDEALLLQIEGKCATTQGKSNVQGSLQVNETGIVGSFISPFANSTITQSASEFSDGRLILSTSIVNNNTGNLSRLRQIITLNEEGGFVAVFQKYENASGEYQDSGKVVFEQK
ncbi:MAG: hypothetical protein AAGA53_00265 [Pseudomonadota bacterium]